MLQVIEIISSIPTFFFSSPQYMEAIYSLSLRSIHTNNKGLCLTVSLSSQILNSRKFIEYAHVSQVLDFIGLQEPTLSSVKKLLLGAQFGVCPQGQSLLPAANFTPGSKILPKKRIPPLGAIFAPGGKDHPGDKDRPQGQNQSLGAKLSPEGNTFLRAQDDTNNTKSLKLPWNFEDTVYPLVWERSFTSVFSIDRGWHCSTSKQRRSSSRSSQKGAPLFLPLLYCFRRLQKKQWLLFCFRRS